MDFRGLYRDSGAGKHCRLNMSAEVNYFYSVVEGELTYSQAHSHCKGTFGNIGPDHMESLLVTESLEVVTKRVTVRENFHTGDMTVLETGGYIPAPSWQGEGIITDFGTLLLKKRRVPCSWRKVRDITADRTGRDSGAETVLVDNDQHIYIPIFD